MRLYSWLASFDERKLWGWLLVSIGSVFFVGYFFVALMSKLLPPSHIPLISALQNDCFLLGSESDIYMRVEWHVKSGRLWISNSDHMVNITFNNVVLGSLHTRYYCFLVPLTLPIIVVAVYFHWLSMQMFKHA